MSPGKSVKYTFFIFDILWTRIICVMRGITTSFSSRYYNLFSSIVMLSTAACLYYFRIVLESQFNGFTGDTLGMILQYRSVKPKFELSDQLPACDCLVLIAWQLLQLQSPQQHECIILDVKESRVTGAEWLCRTYDVLSHVALLFSL